MSMYEKHDIYWNSLLGHIDAYCLSYDTKWNGFKLRDGTFTHLLTKTLPTNNGFTCQWIQVASGQLSMDTGS